MIKSMTAFGRAKIEGEDKDITVELKSVNSRYFDCTLKAPRIYSSLEERIKAHVKQNALSRGNSGRRERPSGAGLVQRQPQRIG